MARLSILVPIYNVERYLEQCLESLLAQTYGDLEIICVDDGSTDSSSEILERAARQDRRVQVIHKENSGYGSSMNLALARAAGAYVGIVESDDFVAPDMYERLMARTKLAPEIDMVRSAHYEVTGETLQKKNLFEQKDCERVITARDCKKLFAVPCNIWSAVYRRDFLLEHGIRFLETPGASYQDTSFYFKAVLMAKAMVLTDDAYYYYRKDNVDSSVNSSGKLFCVRDEICEIDRYMDEKEIRDPYFIGVRNAFMFRGYYWNYNRLDALLKSAFYQEFRRELLRIQKTEEFRPEYWTEWYWNTANRILKDTDQFFWDSVRDVTAARLDGDTVQKTLYAEHVEEYVKMQEKILIYGAGVYGRRVYSYLCRLGVKKAVKGFVVSKGTETIPAIDSVSGDREGILLILAAAERHQVAMMKKAKQLGFTRILRVDGALQEKMKEVVES